MLLQVYLFKVWCFNSPPKPHAFASLPLQSTEPLVIVVTTKIVAVSSTSLKSLLIVAAAVCCAIAG